MFSFKMITTVNPEDFQIGQCYNTCGLINAPIFEKKIREGNRQRVAFMLPSRVQAVIDFVIYNPSDDPVFPEEPSLKL